MDEYSYLKAYQEWCVSKLNKNTNKTKDDMLLNATLGLAESGEIQNVIKQHLFHEHDLDKEKVLDECGDLLFYIAVMLHSLDFTFENAIDFNEIKLNKRYKESATKEESINRKKHKEESRKCIIIENRNKGDHKICEYCNNDNTSLTLHSAKYRYCINCRKNYELFYIYDNGDVE